MAILAFEFFFRLLWGWNFFIFFVSRNESREDFLKVSFRFAAGFAAFAFASAYFVDLPNQNLLWVSLLLIASRLYLSRKFLIFRLLAVFIYVLVPALVFKSRGIIFGSNFILSSWVLGGAFIGQFLGHWYLNVPNIHIREFKRISAMALASIALRFVWVGGSLFLMKVPQEGFQFTGDSDFFAVKGNAWMGMGTFGVILFASRVLWGLLAPAILTLMAKKTVDMRSTQSATGIFYANSVLVLLGEATALYLEKELLWPL